jgi:hypothetical protein
MPCRTIVSSVYPDMYSTFMLGREGSRKGPIPKKGSSEAVWDKISLE